MNMDPTSDSTLVAVPHALAAEAAGAEPPPISSTRVSGTRLLVARVVWGALASLLVGLFALLLPAYWTQLRTVCAGAACAIVQPTPASALTLQQLGVSVAVYATWSFAITLASTLVCLLVGGVIVWRRSDDLMALVAALAAVALGTLYVSYALLPMAHSAWQVPAIALNVVGNATQFLFIALFPGGRFVPRWTRWLVVGWVAGGVAFLGGRTLPWAYLLLNLAWFGIYATLALVQIYRYRHVSSGAERRQAKWVVLGWVSAVGIALGVKALEFLVSPFRQPGAFYALASGFGYILAITVVCVAMGTAILLAHLFDIDLIIHRTLVYSVVTGMLGAVYFGTVLLLQAGFRALTGQESALAVVISTLAIAALFQPVRRQVQQRVDRRFYRPRYDAVRTLATFGVTVRTETDLDELRRQIVAVVDETMQPAHISLWLAPQTRPSNQPATGQNKREQDSLNRDAAAHYRVIQPVTVQAEPE